MSTNKTENLNLHSWEASDPVKRTEFNENWAAIDAAVGELRGTVVTGTYTGDGAEEREINLGFRPRAVLVTLSNGLAYQPNEYYGGLAISGSDAASVAIVDGGFQVKSKYPIASNYSGQRYYYVAVK